jgi:hypothetical protein
MNAGEDRAAMASTESCAQDAPRVPTWELAGRARASHHHIIEPHQVSLDARPRPRLRPSLPDRDRSTRAWMQPDD